MDADLPIRPLRSNDSAAMSRLEVMCPEAAHWGEESYRQIGESGLRGFAAGESGSLVAFILIRVVADEMEILNMAVEPAARRKGIASRLLEEALRNGGESAPARAYLEVRESNAGARAFYMFMGFVESGRRKDYYSQPVEDAIVLVRELD